MQSSRGIDIDAGHDQRRADAGEQQSGQPATAGPAAATGDGAVATPATDELNDELARIEDRYRRALADLDNYRKRSSREIERRTTEVRESMIRDWLDVVDSVERAIRIEPQGPCREGLQAVMQQIDSVLAREGVSRTGAPGEAFDPERHDAVATRAADGTAPHTVVEVPRSGFVLGDRVIRPAQVVVARAPEHSH
jgi:molecular chaperone GrpE